MLTLIDYGAGNLTSVKLALESLGHEAVITSDPDVVRNASRVIFPGVGAASWAMKNLRQRGLLPVLNEIMIRDIPFLGICLGTQILLDRSEEDGGTEVLSLLPGIAKLIQPVDSQYKVPHMGWNQVRQRYRHPILEGIPDESDFYFVHSYYPLPESPDDIIATTDYAGMRFPSIVGCGNLVATQFHIEKSGPAGLRMLENFVRWNGKVDIPIAETDPTSCPQQSAIRQVERRIILCLDVINNRVTKGIKFQNNIDLGDPIELAGKYYLDGADELVVYDITASAERRKIDIEMVRNVARAIHIPFAVGGGISSLDDMAEVLEAGAEKVSINSLAVVNPEIIKHGCKAFGRQCIVLGMDPVSNPDKEKFPSGFEVTIRGFRERTGMDALEWAKRCEDLGVGEIVVNSVDRDGTRDGFELDITGQIARTVHIPVVASGGAGNADHLVEVFQKTEVSAAIVAGILHSGLFTIPQIKEPLIAAGIPIRKHLG